MNALLLALPLLFGAPVAHGEVTVEAHGGTPQGWGLQPVSAGVEVRLTPLLRLEVPGDVQNFEIEYSPSLTWHSWDFQPRPYFVNAGRLAWTGDLSRRLQAFGNAALSAGEQTYYRYLSTPEAPAGTGDFLAPQAPLLLATGNANAGVEWQAGPRQRLWLQASYALNGGLDARSQDVVPLRRQPAVEADGEIDVTRRDVARLEAHFLAPSFTPGPAYRLGVANLSWTRRLTPQTDLTPGVGVFSFLNATGTTVDAAVRPQGWIELTQSLGAHRDFGQLQAKVSYETRLNALDGLPDDTVGGSASWSWRFSPRYIVAVQGAASWVVRDGGTDGDLLRAGLWSRYTIVPRYLSLQAGASVYSQILPARLGGWSARAWDVYLGLTGSLETPHGP